MSEKRIENIINEKLTGETQSNMLNLVTFMRENGFSFDGDGAWWTPKYGDDPVGAIAIALDEMIAANISIAIWSSLDWNMGDISTDDNELKEFTWSHVVNCPQVNMGCNPPHNRSCKNYHNRVVFFGKKFESTCHSPLAFLELSDNSLENIKKLMLLVKQGKNNN